ncbi:MAG: hypothetical protein ACREMR_07575 [Gemmatimonadales bacterium]
MYRELDAGRIVATVHTLDQRIRERFPDSGLAQVAGELVDVAQGTIARVTELSRPNVPIRAAVGVLVAALVTLLAGLVLTLEVSLHVDNVATLLQATESAVNDVVFAGIAIWFLVTLERRIKRGRALKAIHELRSLAHVVDMHQLTKDPDQILSPGRETPSSPRRTRMTRFELARYLDYCSELLSLTSKLAALYVQRFQDEHVLAAVTDVQTLTNGLSGKIWQKIAILETAGPAH